MILPATGSVMAQMIGVKERARLCTYPHLSAFCRRLIRSLFSIEESEGDGEEEDMEMESEDDEPAPQRSRGPLRNPYPLEGKYVDEADREA